MQRTNYFNNVPLMRTTHSIVTFPRTSKLESDFNDYEKEYNFSPKCMLYLYVLLIILLYLFEDYIIFHTSHILSPQALKFWGNGWIFWKKSVFFFSFYVWNWHVVLKIAQKITHYISRWNNLTFYQDKILCDY